MRKHHPVVRHPPGLEWALFKKLPLLTLAGLIVIGLLWIAMRIGSDGPYSMAEGSLGKFEFALIGAAVFHITMMVTLTIGCVVVLIMKGPHYSADSYPVEDAERPDR